MTLFLDLDGTLADFDTAYAAIAGQSPNRQADDVDWQKVVAVPHFYRNLPPMHDMPLLWAYVASYKPVVLTGVPSSIPTAKRDKEVWVEQHLGTHVLVIGCASKDKATFCRPGDVLVDDREKYRDLWEAAGGKWITHTDALSSIDALRVMGY